MAIEFFLAGASAVAIGTANFSNPAVTMQIARDLENYLRSRDIYSISEIVGKVEGVRN